MEKMKLPYFDRSNVSFVNCTGGSNGKLPTQLSSCDIIETANKFFGSEEPIIGLMSPHLIHSLSCVNHFLLYPNTVKSTLFENEIGVLGNIRFIVDDTIEGWSYYNESLPDGISYSIFLLSLDKIYSVQDESDFTYVADNIVDLRSTLFY